MKWSAYIIKWSFTPNKQCRHKRSLVSVMIGPTSIKRFSLHKTYAKLCKRSISLGNLIEKIMQSEPPRKVLRCYERRRSGARFIRLLSWSVKIAFKSQQTSKNYPYSQIFPLTRKHAIIFIHLLPKSGKV